MFIPFIVSLWVMLLGFAVFQYSTMRAYQVDVLRGKLAQVSARVIDAYENDIDPSSYLNFITRYFRDDPAYESLRVTIYKDGQRLQSFGPPIALNREEYTRTGGFTLSPLAEKKHTGKARLGDEDRDTYYSVQTSKDGRLLVYSMVPVFRLSSIASSSMPGNVTLIALAVVVITLSIFAYFSTRYFGRNVENLHLLAETTVDNREKIENMKFSHDELGDISRRIVELYNERIDQAKRIEHEHEVALHAIEERAKNKRQLTNNINHELRTPIGVIKGYLDTIIDNPDMDAESRSHFLRKAREHVNRLVNLIADVSAITRLEEGGDMINTEPLNFHDLVYSVANDLRESGDLKDMKFTFDVPMDCMVMGNHNLLTGVLINLAKNSANYSKGHECRLEMTGEDDKFYRFAFYDDGVGVGEEHIPHLFERFYRVDSGRARKAGGTGLGLPIVYNTIVVHGGTIEVLNRKSEDGVSGLEFRFSLQKVVNKR